MDRGGKPSGESRHREAVAALDEASRLLAAFSNTSVIGLAVCDDQLRFQGINNALAAINGISPEEHVGKTVRDILRDAASQPEPALRRVLDSGQAVCFELAAMLPTRTELGYWIENYFPIKSRQGKANQVATVTVEITAQRKLEKSFRKLSSALFRTGQQQDEWLGRDLHDSINDYHEAITSSLGRLTATLVNLTEHSWEPEKSGEALAQSVAWLDQRVARMRAVVSDVASRFPNHPSAHVM